MNGKTTFFLLLLTAAFITVPFKSGAGLARAINDEQESPSRRTVPHVLLGGQVLLMNLPVRVFVGNPAPPAIVPYAGASLRVYSTARNALVAHVIADMQGRFVIALPPGQYHVVPDLMREQQVLAAGEMHNLIIAGPYESATAFDVTLTANRPVNVTVTYEWNMGS
jgi:hypothetical protein